MLLAETLAILMVVAVVAALMAGYPVALTLAGVSLIFAIAGQMLGVMRRYISVLVASLIEGVGLQPNAEPRPVVKHMTLQPPATWPVAPTGS